jgi:nucleotide-binding universal stress UspA family protein
VDRQVDPSAPVRSPIPALGTVLCAVDTSDMAAGVLYAASGFAAHPQSKLFVLRVDDRANASSEEALAAQVELHDLARRTIPGWLLYREGTEFIVRGGHPSETILATAAECAANLIVTGTRRRGFVSRALFGSVTARVMRETTVPLAVVPPSEMEVISLTERSAVSHLGTVLVPVNLDAGSARQLAFASMLSLASDREIVLLHIVPPNADSHAPLTRLQEMAADVGTHAGVRAVVTHGPVVGAILDRQQRSNAGVVVLGRDPRSPGTVARELLQKTTAVVVFVP